MIGDKFHLCDGLYFIRTEAAIRIELYAIPELPEAKPVWFTEVSLEAFASVIASMSIAGENYETWASALNELKKAT